MARAAHMRAMIVENEPTFQELIKLALANDPYFEIV